MKDCIFCKIINNEIPSIKIWEDDNYLAILDVNPNTLGMSLVIPKKHFDSDVFNLSNARIASFLVATKKVAKKIEKSLDVYRVALVLEGMGVNHLHAKLYPLHGLEEGFQEIWADEKIYFNKYEGFISTQLGPKKSTKELEEIAKRIRSINI